MTWFSFSLWANPEPKQPVQLANSLFESPFDLKNKEHYEIIYAKVVRFETTLNLLSREDNKLINQLLGTLACYLSSYILSPALAGSFYLTYQAGKGDKERERIREEYYAALKDLVATYEWAMGKATTDHISKLNRNEIQHLISTLGPYVPASFIKTWDASTDTYLKSERGNKLSPAFKELLENLLTGKHENTAQYYFYGNHGGLLAGVQKALKAPLNYAVATAANSMTENTFKNN